MDFKRAETKIILAGTEYHIRGLVPADFLSEECWPFRYYRLKDEPTSEESAWKWEEGIKPRWLLEAEARMRKVIALGIVSPKFEPNELVSICQDAKLTQVRNLLFGLIFGLSYGIDAVENYRENSILDRGHLVEIGIKSRELKREPWEIVYGHDDLPEGFNPRRHDFNTMVLKVMFERDGEMARRSTNG
jgi:hypothetical protein